MQRNRKEKITGPAADDDIAPYFSNHCNYRVLTCRPDFLDRLYSNFFSIFEIEFFEPQIIYLKSWEI